MFFLLLFIPIISFSQNEWIMPDKDKNIKNPYLKTPASISEGKQIYNTLCWTCHGKTGDGKGPAAVNLNPSPVSFKSENFSKQKDGEIFYKISNGRGMMIPYKHSINEKQRWFLVNYLKTFYEN